LDPVRPGPKTALKGRGLDLSKYPTERVMRRNPALIWQKSSKPAKLRLSELFERYKIVSTADGSADCKKQDLLNRIERVACAPGVLDLGEAIDQRGLGHGGRAVDSGNSFPET
jgi:hypothetical protein